MEWQQLLAACIRQERAAQKRLYDSYYAYGMSICIRYAHSEPEAIEILNDGFLKVFLHIKRFDQDRPFKPWFRRILINTALKHLKKQSRFKPFEDMQVEDNHYTVEDILSRIHYQDLMRMVQSLSTAYRTVFNLFVIDGYNHEEIAKQLGISVGTSKSNLSKARGKLQEMVRKSLDAKYG